MKTLLSIILGLYSLTMSAQTADDYFKKGMEAYRADNLVAAKKYYSLSAEMGSGKACGALAFMYVFSNTYGVDYWDEARKWAAEGVLRDDMTSAFLAGLLILQRTNNTTDEYDMAMELLQLAYLNNCVGAETPGFWNMLAAGYLKLGKTDLAEKWAKKAYNETSGNSNTVTKDDNYNASAILAKIAFDKKDYDRAILYSMEASRESKCTLAHYVYGACLIKTNKNIAEGKLRVGIAAEATHDDIFDISTCFVNEIQSYWKFIND